MSFEPGVGPDGDPVARVPEALGFTVSSDARTLTDDRGRPFVLLPEGQTGGIPLREGDRGKVGKGLKGGRPGRPR